MSTIPKKTAAFDWEAAWEEMQGPKKDEVAQWYEATERVMIDGSMRSLIAMLYEDLREEVGRQPTLLHEGKSTSHATPHLHALELLFRFGTDYTVHPDGPAYCHGMKDRPDRGKCFGNAARFMKYANENAEDRPNRHVYVEGICYGFLNHEPFLHAWTAHDLTSVRATDWTMYPWSPWQRYFGIPFTEQEFHELQEILHPGDSIRGERFRTGPLFHAPQFTVLETRIREILAQREPPADSS